MCVPVILRSSRMKWTSRRRGSTSAFFTVPLTVTEISMSVLSLRPGDRLTERASREDADERAFVIDRSPKILGRLRLLGRDARRFLNVFLVRRFAQQRLLRAHGPDRRHADVGEADSHSLARVAVESDLGSNGSGGKISDFALDLEVRAAAAGGRDGDADLGQDLVGGKRGCKEAGEEAADRNRARSLRSSCNHVDF